MTTIAVRDGILAVDSKVTLGHIETNSAVKAYKNDDIICSACGNADDCVVFTTWALDGMKKEDIPKYADNMEFDGIVITKKGKVFNYTNRFTPITYNNKFFAMGSGYQIALGAMAMGASAEEAVRITSKYDVYTGGKIRKFSF